MIESVATELPTIASVDFKAAMRGLAATVCVVTARHGMLSNGMTATAVCSVSADPASLLVVVNQANRSSSLIRKSGAFAVHLLSKKQEGLARHFASRPDDPFAEVPIEDGVTTAPLIEDCETAFECVVEASTEFSTHTIFVGRIVGCRYAVTEPLLYCQGTFGSMA